MPLPLVLLVVLVLMRQMPPQLLQPLVLIVSPLAVLPVLRARLPDRAC